MGAAVEAPDPPWSITTEIAYFGILEEYFGKKCGGYLLSEAIKKLFDEGASRVWLHTCSLDHQNSIKKSSKSTPITYINAFDTIRNLLASQPLAKIKNLKAKDFSFNVSGGRCEHCKGQGYVIIEMQFLADIKIDCEICNGSIHNCFLDRSNRRIGS